MNKVIVGMSGGVDSAVAAALLLEQGYEVEGLFMKNWDSVTNNDIKGNATINDVICPQEQDYLDAKSVCDKLGIKLHRVNFVKEYWDHVFSYFLDELKLGRTPNPDVMCNKYIKFDYFIKEAKRLGADYIATGHYAILENNKLYKGIDSNKDQTYFLAQLSNEQLKNVLFPVGKLNKSEVRMLAEKYNLSVSHKKDSTGICFIGERNFKKFLENYLPNKKGNIIDIDTNEIVGEHSGLMYYTIGQRRGLDIGGNPSRTFVVGKDMTKNILYISDNEEYLISTSCIIDSLNLLTDKLSSNCNAKFRYRSNDIKVHLEQANDKELLVTYESAKSVTPGQLCVLYDGNRCVGSGIIKEVRKRNEKLWYLL
ncbi:MAG TPA: tRNA 2-thiouridine(34) synthase MnmA [Bacilli bacterium]|nr:tRNA 2-thiouridine(34) synthase MnmA [Bacilli bacterium]